MAVDYDAFLSYAADRLFADALAARLADSAGLLVDAAPRTGRGADPALLARLDASAACVLCLGPAGLEPWRDQKTWAALSVRSSLGMLRIVLVRCPGAADTIAPADSAPLQPIATIDYRAGLDDAAALAALTEALGGYSQAAVSADERPPFGGGMALAGAPRFQERPELAALLAFRNGGERGVLAIVGDGGAGKTALLAHLLQAQPAEVFAWSFADQPDVESFASALWGALNPGGPPLGAANGHPARDLIYRVIRLLQTSRRRALLALDGLEILQENGRLRDSSMRHLLRCAAAGWINAQVIATSRSPLADLERWRGSGYGVLELGELPDPSARAILRAHGLPAADQQIDALLAAYGRHPLTLDLLGGLLATAKAKQPLAAPPAAGPDQGLAAVLAAYRERLPALELQILELLSIFGAPVPPDALTEVFTAPRREHDDPKSVPLVDAPALDAALGRLMARRLLRTTADGAIALIHPAVGAFFAANAGIDRRQAHSDAANALFSQVLKLIIASADGNDPTKSRRVLDLAEAMIDHSIRGRDAKSGLERYGSPLLRGYRHLGVRAAAYQHGLRITTRLVAAGGIALEGNRNVYPWHDRSLFLLGLGRPAEAEQAMRETLDYYRATVDHHTRHPAEGPPRNQRANWLYYEAGLLQCLADALLAQGRLAEAEQAADEVLNAVDEAYWCVRARLVAESGSNPFGRRAIARFLAGKVAAALDDFAAAEPFQYLVYPHGRTIGGYYAPFHALLLIRLGRLGDARALLAPYAAESANRPAPLLAAQYRLAWAEWHLARGDVAAALPRLDEALGWAIGVGRQDVCARALIGKARICLRLGEADRAADLLEQAEGIARESGFAIWLVDAQMEVVLSRQNAHEALDFIVLGAAVGAAEVNFSAITPQGRGRQRAEDLLDHAAWRELSGRLREASLAAPLPVTPNCAFLGPCYANIEPHITCDGWMTPCYLSPVKLFAILETPPETMREHLRRKRLAFQDTCGRGAWLRPTAAPLSAAG